VGQQSSASASRLLGQDVFEVLAAQVVGGEWQFEVQTTAGVVGACAIRVSVARMPKQGAGAPVVVVTAAAPLGASFQVVC
jgi:hypothetical protein